MKNKLMLENIVKEILMTDKESRIDDFILISRVLEKTNPETRYMTIGMVLEKGKILKIPPFASITRARRKVFEKYPELCPEPTKKERKAEEKVYKEWSRV